MTLSLPYKTICHRVTETPPWQTSSNICLWLIQYIKHLTKHIDHYDEPNHSDIDIANYSTRDTLFIPMG